MCLHIFHVSERATPYVIGWGYVYFTEVPLKSVFINTYFPPAPLGIGGW